MSPSLRSADTSAWSSPASTATGVWAATQYRQLMTADVRKITSSFGRSGMELGPRAAPRNGMATSSSSGTWASEAAIGPGSPSAK